MAEFAEILRGSQYVSGSRLDDVARLAAEVSVCLPLDQQARELAELIKRARGLPPAR